MQASRPNTLAAWRGLDDGRRTAELRRLLDATATYRESHGAFTFIAGPEGLSPVGDGPLRGVPFAVKDNIDVAGIATTAGSPVFVDNHPQVDAGAVSVMRQLGAVPVAKTNMHELALGVTGNNAFFGPVRNPADLTLTAGGSSGGSAAAVALGVVPVSLGTDTGGSVTLPASFCGVVGFRPSTGRYPGQGVVNISWTRDTVGVHTTTVSDARTVDAAITKTTLSREPVDLRGLRVGVLRERFEDLDPVVSETAEHTLAVLRNRGAQLMDVAIEDEIALAHEPGLSVVLFEAIRLLPSRIVLLGGDRGPDWIAQVSSPDVRGLLEFAYESPVSIVHYEAARGDLWQLRANYAQAMTDSGVDVLIGPTCSVLPPRIGEDSVMASPHGEVPVFHTLTRNTSAGTAAGVPMISLPVGRPGSDVPVGMMLEGAPFADAHLLQIAAAVEAALLAEAAT